MEIDFLTVVCGKRQCLSDWLDYIATIPFAKYGKATWIIVDNSLDENFKRELVEGIESRQLSSKFEKIVNVRGPGMFVPPEGKNWRDNDVCIGKHRSTGESFSLGFSLCSAEFTYTIDDDIIPPADAFDKLMHVMQNPEVGASAGLYFNHSGWNANNPWRTEEELKRTVVASVKKEHWFPAMIDDYWGNGLVDSGYVGTGITIWRTDPAKECLPLQTIVREDTGLILGPDGYLSEKLRELGFKINVDSSILCEHRDDTGGEAGLGVRKFMDNLNATESAVMVGSFGNLEQRLQTYTLARHIADKLDSKVILAWPQGMEKFSHQNCPWSADGRISEIKYFKYTEYCNKYEKVSPQSRRERKVLDQLYYECINSGKYAKIYNLMHTTETRPNHFSEFRMKYRELFGMKLGTRGFLKMRTGVVPSPTNGDGI
jgi:hypothetical protein